MGGIVKIEDGWHSQIRGWVAWSNLWICMVIKIVDRNGSQASI